jgi:hypothetical protein
MLTHNGATKVGLFALLMLVEGIAFAGETFWGTAATQEEACWIANQKANNYSYGGSGCYKPCHQCTATNGSTKCRSVGHNQSGSCGGSTRAISPADFAKTKPGYHEPTPNSVGNNVVRFVPNYQGNTNMALIRIVNNGTGSADTLFRVWARDSRYSFPTRVVHEQRVTVAPGVPFETVVQSWGAVEWRLEQAQ